MGFQGGALGPSHSIVLVDFLDRPQVQAQGLWAHGPSPTMGPSGCQVDPNGIADVWAVGSQCPMGARPILFGYLLEAI